jgi:hypothetical protein
MKKIKIILSCTYFCIGFFVNVIIGQELRGCFGLDDSIFDIQ